MCGIAGYIGPKKTIAVLLKSLEQIEYRGYDSAGIALHTKTGLKRIRSKGSLNLIKKHIPSFENISSGIGHVRWATHGAPSKINAHPQKKGKIHIVHNGTIENSLELKENLSYKFESETDTEVIACLIDQFYLKNADLLQSVIETNKILKGSYAYVLLCENLNKHIIGCRKGPPLIVGPGKKGEFFISSDLPSILQWTKQVYILNNQEIFYIQNNKCQFFSFNGKLIQKKIQNIQFSQKIKNKKHNSHFMLQEIFEQPSSVLSIIQNNINPFQKLTQIKNHLRIIACGSSYYAALYGKYAIESLARIPVEVDLASEFQYKNPIIKKGTPILFISQSGETADTLSSLNKAKEKKAFCITLCNVKNSSLDRSGDLNFYINAGPEMAVASTKTFTSTLATLLLLALSKKKRTSHFISSLKLLPYQMEQILSKKEFFKSMGKELKKFKGFLYLGRGPHYPIALEGALKMKELAYIHAEGYPSGEMKHGPLALVDHNMLIIGLAPQDEHYQKNLTNLEEALARKGRLLTLGNNEDKKLKSISDYYVDIPQNLSLISPLLETIPLQLFSYYLACSLGHDPDHPRNLAKSVTVE